MSSLISVIIPVFNVEKYLKRCLDSVVNQTYKNLEIILVDDGSQDGSGEICDKYSQVDPRIVVFHTSNFGQSAARNTGLKNVMGDYVGFIDADDFISADYFEKLLKIIKENNASLVCEIDDLNRSSEILDKEQTIVRVMGGDLKTVVWNKMFRYDVLKDIYFPIGQVHEEIEFNRKYLNRINNCVVIKADGYKYTHQRDGNTESTFEESRLKTYLQITEFIDELSNEHLFKAKKAVNLFGLVHFKDMYKVSLRTKQSKITKKIIKKYYRVLLRKAIFNGAFKHKSKELILAVWFGILPNIYLKWFV